ncbi:oligosaccharide repeat unit polymerase [Acidobacteria bacterium AH-259-L09]|nr:oligosaccharide repeat unit polymerase [Acidobacteria bacterium AH-259-L09]
MLVAFLGIIPAFVLRLLVLSFDDSMFQFSHLVTLSRETVERVLWFMAGGTFAFWVGLRLTAQRTCRSTDGSRATNQLHSVMHYRHLLLAIGLVVVSIPLFIYARLGDQWTFSEQAFLMRFLPVEGMVFVLMYLAVRYWKGLSLGEKAALIMFFVLNFFAEFSLGQRGALFRPAILWLIVMILVKWDPRIPIRWVMGVALIIPFVLPAFLELVVIARDTYYKGGTLSSSVEQIMDEGVLSISFKDTALMFSNRLNGFDASVAVMNYHPMGLEAYSTPVALLKSTMGYLVPDNVWSSDVPSLGRQFAIFYQGIVGRHSGAYSGFGVFYHYFGPLGVFALGGLGAFIGAVLVRLLRGGVLSGPLSGFLLHNFVWMVFTSGNLDNYIATYLSNALLVGLILWTIIVLHQGARPVKENVKPERCRRPRVSAEGREVRPNIS